MRLRSLKNKLALVFGGITLLAMAGVWIYIVPQLESNLRAQRLDDVSRVATATVDSLVRYNRGNEIRPKRLDELVRDISDKSDAHVTLFTMPRSRSRPPNLPTELSDSAASPNIDQTTALADAAGMTNRRQVGFGTLNGKSVAQVALPIGTKRRAEWVVLYSRSLDGVTETVDLIRRRLFAAGVLAGLLAVAAAYLVAGMVGGSGAAASRVTAADQR